MNDAPHTAEEDPGKALVPRTPTFLARYRRRFKVGVVLAGVVALILLPPLVRGVTLIFHHNPKKTPFIESADRVTQDAGQVGEDNTGDKISADGSLDISVYNAQNDRNIKLAQAPLPGLSEDSPEGPAPRISETGQLPWQAYARPFNLADPRPKIAIVMANIGLARFASDQAINRLPANVTMGIDLEGTSVSAWADRARQAGHETILVMPMEPFGYPYSDPGAHALLTRLPTSDNLLRLLWGLRQASGYIGITSFSGSHFSTVPEKLTPILQELKQRGLMVLDARVAPHSTIEDLARQMQVPRAAVTSVIDLDPVPSSIDNALSQLEQTARINGYAVAVASPYPSPLDRLEVWSKGLPKRGIALAPLSAMVK